MLQIIPHQRHLLTRLQREWDRLAVSPAAIAAADGWRVWTAPLHSLDDLLVLSGYGVGERDVIACDRVLRDLVLIARADRLAARVVLQRLLPGISAMSRRNSSVLAGDRLDALDEAIATAWPVIRLYPLEQRPRYVVANMLREIEYQAFKRDRRRKAEFVPIDSTDLDLVPVDDATALLGDGAAGAARRGAARRVRRCRRRARGTARRRRQRGAAGVGPERDGADDPQPPCDRRAPPPAARAGLSPSMSRARQERSVNFGLRFSRNAAMPSWASAVVAAAAITSVAYRYAFGWSRSTWA
jgi:hypothetical protein